MVALKEGFSSASRVDSLHELRACFKLQHAWIFTLWRPLYAAVSVSEMNYINGKHDSLKKKIFKGTF